MSSAQSLRHFISERLTAAIYNHREEPEPCQTMESLEDLEPEQMQEKRDEQELYHIKNEQEQQHPLQIKGEQEELCIGLEEEQLEMKQMMNTFMEIPTYEERFHREPDPDVDHLLVQTSSDSDNQSQEEIDHYDTKSRTETLNNNRHQKIRGQSDDVQSPSEKPFSCLTCGRKFSEKRSMLRHIRVHTGEKPFQCLTCGKRFSLKDTLSRHIKIHTGEKSYSCSVCGKRFIQSFGLTRHIRTHTRQRPVLQPQRTSRGTETGQANGSEPEQAGSEVQESKDSSHEPFRWEQTGSVV
uniref:C2H2-type domain-containing protein n=1 Tax=Cyprinodon variegatus TaxID=28743 RepID=A0A3Q2GID2_CYPVA